MIQSDALELLWSYLFNSHSEDYLDFQNVNKTLLSLSTLLKKADLEVVKGYFKKIFESLKEDSNYLKLKIVAQFLKERTFTALNTRKNLVDELEEQYGLLDLILKELTKYMDKLKVYVE